MAFDIFETLRKLAAAYGPSGQEGEVAGLIAEMARPCADEVYTDRIGNLIARKKGPGPRVMVSAHMDSVGLMVTHIDEKGFLWVSQIGGVAAPRVRGTVVRFAGGVRGVVSVRGKADQKDLKVADLFIDIGAADEASARRKVGVGDVAVFDGPAFLMGDGLLASPYLDARIACAVQLGALARLEKPLNDVFFVFSAQEELGIRGAKTAAWDIDPEYGFSVDVCPTGDIPETTPRMEVRLGGGAAVKIMDESVMCHSGVVSWLKDAAAARGIPYQMEILRAGGTDAGAIHVSRAGVYTGAVSIPARYIHGPAEVCAIADAEACVRMVEAACEIRL